MKDGGSSEDDLFQNPAFLPFGGLGLYHVTVISNVHNKMLGPEL